MAPVDETRQDLQRIVDANTSIRAMQDAALEHALLSATGDSDYVAFAGALERARGERQLSLSGVMLLACLVSLHLCHREDRLFDVAAGDRTGDDPLVAGAHVAMERFDLSTADAAALANRSVDDFETEIERQERSV
jgi:hypothetical protein